MNSGAVLDAKGGFVGLAMSGQASGVQRAIRLGIRFTGLPLTRDCPVMIFAGLTGIGQGHTRRQGHPAR